MKKEPLIFVRHILESIENIESFSRGLSKNKFENDRLRQSAVIRELEIIGQAVKNHETFSPSRHFQASFRNNSIEERYRKCANCIEFP